MVSLVLGNIVLDNTKYLTGERPPLIRPNPFKICMKITNLRFDCIYFVSIYFPIDFMN